MVKLSANNTANIQFVEQGSDPATPAAGKRRIYAKGDGFYEVDDAGAVTGPFGVAGAGGVTVQDEGTPLATTATTLDFVGAGVTATGSGATKTITIPGGGGAAYDPIADIFGAPDTAYEFDTSSLTGLTARGSPTTTNADTTVPDHLYIADNNSGFDICGYDQASPATPWTAITKITDSTVRQNHNSAGIYFSSSSAGSPALTDFLHIYAATRAVKIDRETNLTTFGSTVITSGITNAAYPFWLAIRANSNTNVDYFFSYDGQTWQAITTARNPSLTIAFVGIAMKSENAANVSVVWDYFRIWNSAKTFLGV